MNNITKTAPDISSSYTPYHASPIVQGFLLPPAIGGNGSWAASLINPCNNMGTYVMRCTSGTVPFATCGPYAPARCPSNPYRMIANPFKQTLTVTQGIDTFAITTTTSSSGTSVSMVETCTITGWYGASCVAHHYTSQNGKKTSTAITTSWGGVNDSAEFSSHV